jgi:hypothetical protein
MVGRWSDRLISHCFLWQTKYTKTFGYGFKCYAWHWVTYPILRCHFSFLNNKSPCHGSRGYLPASHRGGPGSTPSKFMWDLWWTKMQVGTFFSEYFRSSPVNAIHISFIYHRQCIILANDSVLRQNTSLGQAFAVTLVSKLFFFPH